MGLPVEPLNRGMVATCHLPACHLLPPPAAALPLITYFCFVLGWLTTRQFWFSSTIMNYILLNDTIAMNDFKMGFHTIIFFYSILIFLNFGFNGS
jgi:hypothetical protein